MPKPEHLCSASLRPRKPTADRREPEGIPCPSPVAAWPDPAGCWCHVLGSGVTPQSYAGCFCWGQAPSLPCKPSCAGLPSPCSMIGAVNMFFCSALPPPARGEAACLRHCLAKQTVAQGSLQEACPGTESCLLCLFTPLLGAGTWGSVWREV